MPAPTPTKTAVLPQPAAKPAHPEIVGVAWFRDKDGWRAAKIQTRDPSILRSVGAPNLKSITFSEVKNHVIDLWETDF